MVRFSWRVILSLLLSFLFFSSVSTTRIWASDGPVTEENGYVSNEVIVKYKKGLTPGDLNRKVQVRAEREQSFIGKLVNLQEDFRFRFEGKLSPEELLSQLEAIRSSLSVVNENSVFPNEADELALYRLITISSNTDVNEVIEELRSTDSVEIAEPNLIMEAHATPSDARYSQMWALSRISAEAAWDVTKGSNDVIVADLDTGLDEGHEDFAGRNIVTIQDSVQDRNGHGTHTAGTIAAMTDNSTGISGINWNVTLMPIRVLNSAGSGSTSTVAPGIIAAVDNGAKVINMSLGGTQSSSCPSLYRQALNYAYENNVTVVVSAGNKNSNAGDFPLANCPHVIVVSATGSNDERAFYSNYGGAIDVAAPGGNVSADRNGDGKFSSKDCVIDECVLSTVPGGYSAWEGTSMAAPHVTGLVALLLSLNPNLTPDRVREILTSTADDLGPPGRDNQFGFGRINAARAVAEVGEAGPTTTPSGPTVTPGGPTETSIPEGPTSTPGGVTPTITQSPTPTIFQSTPTPTPWIPDGCPDECVIAHPDDEQDNLFRREGNANCDEKVDEQDYEEWRKQFLVFQEGGGIVKEERTADFYCLEEDPSTQGVDMIDFEIWRAHAFPPVVTPRPTPSPTPLVAVTPTPTPTPTPITTPTRADNISFGNALSLNGRPGNSEYIYLETGSFFTNTGELTIEGWFNLDGFNDQLTDVVLVSRIRQDIPQVPWVIFIPDKTKQLKRFSFLSCDEFFSEDCLQTGFAVGETDLQLNKWYHFAVVWKGDAITGYLDGKKEFFLPRQFNVLRDSTDYPLTIGAICGKGCGDNEPGNVPAGFFNGKLDEIRISNKARYSDEFSVVDKPFDVDDATFALWRFNESGGEVIHDASGNGHSGELIGEGEFVPH